MKPASRRSDSPERRLTDADVADVWCPKCRRWLPYGPMREAGLSVSQFTRQHNYEAHSG